MNFIFGLFVSLFFYNNLCSPPKTRVNLEKMSAESFGVKLDGVYYNCLEVLWNDSVKAMKAPGKKVESQLYSCFYCPDGEVYVFLFFPGDSGSVQEAENREAYKKIIEKLDFLGVTISQSSDSRSLSISSREIKKVGDYVNSPSAFLSVAFGRSATAAFCERGVCQDGGDEVREAMSMMESFSLGGPQSVCRPSTPGDHGDDD